MALAPEQTGIGLRRHFTTEGVDPYDEVEWERRDARITNFRDGSVAFEQTDVDGLNVAFATSPVIIRRGPRREPARPSVVRASLTVTAGRPFVTRVIWPR